MANDDFDLLFDEENYNEDGEHCSEWLPDPEEEEIEDFGDDDPPDEDFDPDDFDPDSMDY